MRAHQPVAAPESLEEQAGQLASEDIRAATLSEHHSLRWFDGSRMVCLIVTAA